MSESGSTVPRRQLGRHLRDLRLQAGMTMPEAARLIERGTTTLQRLETGQTHKIRLLDIRELCSVYSASDVVTAGLLGLAQEASGKSWWHDYGKLIPEDFNVYVGLEAAARRLTSYSPDVVLGLLQTPDYARILARTASPTDTPDEIERRVQLKRRRQNILTRKRQPTEFDVVLLECALRRVVGSRQIMAAQLRHLADMSTRPNLTLRVLPYSAGIPLGDPVGMFTVVDFGLDKKNEPIEPSVVYLENFTGDLYLESQADVERYHVAHASIRRAALDETNSRSLLRQLARECAT
ncbi:helix-turn-helix domain-containing protein [Nocardia sp. NBC_00565]|uniref:helix-turn-helix domain-containing protein n=1 Tax=Nocardia sp. NBC_00565 TaxID=2975993 RepID=UPI002E8061AD|nr:helix-turn-helix transcriptional regulator [Nocardia sp. NBC_00565]WUC02174.1 helix-turn-helix domain-containing protein [Nocardia sp. NBC_00565]